MKLFRKYIFPPLYGLVVYFSIRLLLDSVTHMKFWERSFRLNALEIGVSLVMGYVVAGVFNRLFAYFDRRWSHETGYKRIIRELAILFVVNFFLQNLLITPVAAFTDDGLQWYDIVDINTIPLFYAFIYYGIVRSSTFFKAYVNNKVLLEKINSDRLQTELKFLKAQYHPHFLFNALNTIYFQMDESVAEAKKSIEKFSELLRYQLYDQQQTVPLSQEIEYLQNYVELQRLRVTDKLKLDMRFDSRMNGQQVYPLLMLPLVENAFKYAGGAYELSIHANLPAENILEFRVENSVPTPLPTHKSGGIGLENLKRRLELLYPERHNLVAKNVGEKFIAELKLELDEHRK